MKLICSCCGGVEKTYLLNFPKPLVINNTLRYADVATVYLHNDLIENNDDEELKRMIMHLVTQVSTLNSSRVLRCSDLFLTKYKIQLDDCNKTVIQHKIEWFYNINKKQETNNDTEKISPLT